MASPFSLKPLSLGGWDPKKHRFISARSYFSFETLSFASVNDADRLSSTDDLSSTLSGDSNHFKYIEHTNVDPSQRLVKKSASKQGATMRFDGKSYVPRNSAGSQDLEDLQELATAELRMVGREKELEDLQELYKNKEIKMTTLVGSSGLGKSVLAQAMVSTIKNSGGIVCGGKFDIQNRADPYQAFVEAIGSFIKKVTSSKRRKQALNDLINDTIGEEVDILLELVPSMSRLLKTDSSRPERPEQQQEQQQEDQFFSPRRRRSSLMGRSSSARTRPNEKVNERSITERAARIQHVLVEFLKVASSEEQPLCLVLDDIQWAGSASLGLIEALLEDDQLEHFFLLATCREAYLRTDTIPTVDPAPFAEAVAEAVADESASLEQPCPQLIDMLERYCKQSAKLFLQPLKTASVHKMINTLLRMGEETKKSQKLAEIVHSKTMGNPFFVVQFMNVLVDEGFLVYNLGSFEWTWIDGDIQSQNVAANVAEAVFKRLKKMAPEDLFVLQVVSAIGNSFEHSTIAFVLEGLEEKLADEWTDVVWPDNVGWVLARLTEAGVIESQYGQGRFDFAHDQIQAAAFRLIPDDRKQVLQLAIGMRLIEGLDATHRDQFMFPAVELCLAGMQLIDERRKRHFAFWAFVAGDMALKQGAFATALRFLDSSILALDGRAFEIDEELALPLFCGAIEAAFALGADNVHAYIAVVEAQQHISVVNRARMHPIKLKLLAGKGLFPECNFALCVLLKELGLADVSAKSGLLLAVFELKKTQRLANKYSNKDILDLPICDDPKVNLSLQLADAAMTSLYLGNAALFIIVMCKSFQVCLKKGITPASPMMFAAMGNLLTNVMKDPVKGLQLAEAALSLCEKYEYKKILSFVIGTTFAFVRHWQKPMQQYVAPLRYGIDVGMRLGTLDAAAMNMGMFCMLVNSSCITPLTQALPEMERYVKNIRHMKKTDSLNPALCSVQYVQKMIRPHRNNKTLDGDLMNEQEILQFATDQGDKISIGLVHFYKIQLLVYFGHPVEAVPYGDKETDYGVAHGVGTPIVPRLAFFIALANLQAYGINQKSKYLRTAKSMKCRLTAWAEQKNPNVPHFLFILKAEKIRAKRNGREKEALGHYNEAAVIARRTGSSLDHALANELRALLYADRKTKVYDKDQASYHMKEAFESYMEYGAKTKALYLQRVHSDLLGGRASDS